MIRIIKNNALWETIGYISLGLCIIGQITVGYYYLFAQTVYLVANTASLVRSVCIKLPRANVVKDITFTAITLGLIIINLF